jgi:hypothetical protein
MPNRNSVYPRITLVLLIAFSSACFGQSHPDARFITLEAAQPLLKAMGNELPSGLSAIRPLDAAKWSGWVQSKDQEVRKRLIRGQEDTLVNLLRFGVTFTKQYRIDDAHLVLVGQNPLVDTVAEHRANDLIQAWLGSNPPESLLEMRIFIQKRGYSLHTAQERAATKKYLLDNLSRLRDEFLRYKAQPKDERRFQLFQDRGISLDTNLWPDYLLNVAFRSLQEHGLLKPGGVKRVAVVGPGLDVANKEAGNDFYPPQTIQPFAVLDSLLRLKIADPKPIEVDTLDISQDVNVHIARIRQNASNGRWYTIQLPWNTERPMSEDYRARFIEYWQELGDQVGHPVAPIQVPEAAASTRTRAVMIRPEIVRRVVPFDVDVVYERLPLSADRLYDLIIGTNIFLYYGAFEQSLARVNLSAMLRPGGFLISNDRLADKVSSGLKDVLEVPVVSSEQPYYIKDIAFCYRRGDY